MNTVLTVGRMQIKIQQYR